MNSTYGLARTTEDCRIFRPEPKTKLCPICKKRRPLDRFPEAKRARKNKKEVKSDVCINCAF